MYLCPTYVLAVVFCVVTMFCWGSWANTQKLVNKKWRYELFYWDYVIGVLATSLIFAYTMGSRGEFGRNFILDLSQAEVSSLGWAFAGGVVFNIANILLVSAIDIAGMSVAFPVGIGLALVLGVIWNFLAAPNASGNPALLFLGVGLVAVAIVLSALSYKKRDAANADPNAPKKPIGKGLALSLLCGVLMSLFYFFVAKSLAPVVTGAAQGQTFEVTLTNLKVPGATLELGKLTPYTANVLFALGVLASNCIVMPILMRFPISGEPVKMGAYMQGSIGDHFWGWVGGAVWAVGMTLNVIASGVASAAVAYGLGQGATLMSAIWGVFIWREFKGAPKGVSKILAAMFLFFVVGLGLIIWTKLGAPAPAQPPSWSEPAPQTGVAGGEIPTFEQAMEEPETFDPIEDQTEPGDDPFAEEPAPAEEPAAEEPAPAEEPAAEEPTPAEEPVAEEPAPAEEPTAEEPAPAEEPAVEEPAPAEEPAAEEPAPAEEPAADEPASAEEPAADEPAPAEESVAEEPAVEEPAPAEEPAAEEPAPAEAPAAEESAPAEEPAPAEAPAAEEPAPVEQPVAEEPAPAADTEPEIELPKE